MKIKTLAFLAIFFGICAGSHAQVTIIISTPDTNVCDNQSVTFTASITGCTNPYVIYWTDGFQIQDTCYSPCNTWTTTLASGGHGIWCSMTCSPQGNDNSNQIDMIAAPCSGVEELENNLLTTVYPNPSTETITIDFIAKGNFISTFTVYDRNGKKMNVKYEMTQNNVVFRAAQFPQGLYHYRLTDEKGMKRAAGKFVIAK